MKQNHKDSSNRPYQTLLPLSKELNIPIYNEIKRDSINDLIKFIFNKLENTENNNILICWEHTVIADIIKEILKRQGIKHIELLWGKNPESKKEDDDDYSSMWVLNFAVQCERDNFRIETLKVYNSFEIKKLQSIYSENNDNIFNLKF